MMKLYPSQLLHSMNTYYFYYSYYVIRQQQQIGCHVLYATDDRVLFHSWNWKKVLNIKIY